MTIEVGLTGNIGAGKTTVAEALARRGAVVIDADALAGRALADPEVVAELRSAFGEAVAPEGTVDRGALAARAFASDADRRRLEGIVHPRVRAAADAVVARLRSAAEPPPMIVHDVPLLFETGRDRDMDAVVLVDAPLALRTRRVTARSGLPEEEVRARDAAQWPAERKRPRADVVIDNDGSRERLEEQVEEAWRRLTGSA